MVQVRDVHEAAALIDAWGSESLSPAECGQAAFEGLMAIRELLPSLGEQAVAGVGFIVLAEDGTATFVVAGESYRAVQLLWRSVQ